MAVWGRANRAKPSPGSSNFLHVQACAGSLHGDDAASAPMIETPAKPSFRPQVWLAAGVLLLAYAVACLKIARNTSPTFDEPDYLAVGYHALVTGQRPYTNINLTFTQLWSSLPLLLAGTPPDIEVPPDWPAGQPVAQRNAAARIEWEKNAAELRAKDKDAVIPPFKPEPMPRLPVTWYADWIRKLSPVTLFARAPHFPTTAEQAAAQATGINYGRLFMFDNRPDVQPEDRNNTEQLVFWSRAMVTLLAVVLGAVVFLFTRRLWGDVAGLVALALYCLNPQTIALGSFATTDISSTLFFVLSVLAVWRLLGRVTPLNILLTGLAAGVLAATKISSLMLLPVAVLLLALRLIGPRVWGAHLPERERSTPPWPLMVAGVAAAVFVAYVTLWGIYGFRFYSCDWTAYLAANKPDDYANMWASNTLVKSHAARPVIKFFRELHLFPEAYLYDLNLFTTTGSIRRAFILGEYSVDGWWYFFPVAWLFKTPLPLIIALGTGIALLWRARREQAAAIWALAPLVVFCGVYGAATLAGNLNIGARHLLPLHPLMFVLGGAVVLLPLTALLRWAATGAVVVWSFAEAALVHPHHLAYYNQLAGGPLHGHRILVDSSYEWGEGLPKIRDWLNERTKRLKDKPPTPIFISYFGCADLEHYGLKNIVQVGDGGNAIYLPSFYDQRPTRAYDLAAGTYVISATMLKSLYGGRTMGPWRQSTEEAYRSISNDMVRLREALNNESKRDEFLEKEGRAIIAQLAALMANESAQPGRTLNDSAQFAATTAVSNGVPPQLALQLVNLIANQLAGETKRPSAPEFGSALAGRFAREQVLLLSNTFWQKKLRDYDDLRFARLCAYLRQREPESRIGYGIFVFELTSDELARALDPAGRPAELRPNYFVKGTENRQDGEIDFIR